VLESDSIVHSCIVVGIDGGLDTKKIIPLKLLRQIFHLWQTNLTGTIIRQVYYSAVINILHHKCVFFLEYVLVGV
jgi:hypothetical protein